MNQWIHILLLPLIHIGFLLEFRMEIWVLNGEKEPHYAAPGKAALSEISTLLHCLKLLNSTRYSFAKEKNRKWFFLHALCYEDSFASCEGIVKLQLKYLIFFPMLCQQDLMNNVAAE